MRTKDTGVDFISISPEISIPQNSKTNRLRYLNFTTLRCIALGTHTTGNGALSHRVGLEQEVGSLDCAFAVVLRRNKLSANDSISAVHCFPGCGDGCNHDIAGVRDFHERDATSLIPKRGYFGGTIIAEKVCLLCLVVGHKTKLK